MRVISLVSGSMYLNCFNSMQWCVAGQCVSDTRAASVPDSCVFGDTPGVISNGMDCATLISSFPGYCYQSFYQGKCCGSCASAYISYIPGKWYSCYVEICQFTFCSHFSFDILNELWKWQFKFTLHVCEIVKLKNLFQDVSMVTTILDAWLLRVHITLQQL